ncbi:hypothetical protein ACIO3O_26440 [Streptomyces sp. NPDC087440]|uniref:hypothetical protein n=1 Tax=Streptomyces sp. NPDC087440 TaxID=3365790 RepID=UPI00382DF90F
MSETPPPPPPEGGPGGPNLEGPQWDKPQQGGPSWGTPHGTPQGGPGGPTPYANGPTPYPPPPGGPGGPTPYPGYGHQPPPPPRKRRRWPWVLLVLAILLFGGCAAIVAVIGKAVDDEDKRVAKVAYEVTGDAKDVTITYSTFSNGATSANTVNKAPLPWKKEVDVKGLVKGGALTVTTGESGGTATCSVTVDGGKPRTATATGPFAVATCDGF